MANIESLGKVIHTDILIVGGGSTGLWAAKGAREKKAEVLIVDKGPRDWGGLASLAGGDLDAVLPEENVDDFVQDLVYYYDGLCEQTLMEELYKRSYDRLKDYQNFGCEFLPDKDGKLKGIPQRGLDHIKLYPAKYKGMGGRDMMQGLMREVIRLGVARLYRTLVTDLLKNDGRVVGAVGFNTLNGEFIIFNAKAVIIATGAGGWKASYGQNTSTGEGIYMAFKAGAELRNFEFAKVWNVPKQFSWESQTTLLPLGARFVNAKGESFMDKYSPSLGANTDPHYIVIGMSIEAREGRGPIYFDVSQMNPDDIKMVKPQTGWQLANYEKLVKLGLDVFKEKTEWMPQMLGSFGGLTADLEGKTKVPGLFVAGRGRSIDPGVYIGGFALFTTAVTGYITGPSAARYAQSLDFHNIQKDEVIQVKENLFSHLGKAGIPPKEVLTEVQEIIYPYDICILKNEKSLNTALKRLEKLKSDYLPLMTAQTPHYLLKLKEIESIVFLSELYLKTSLLRTESRGGHYREDYPDRDDNNWLKWIILYNDEGQLKMRTDPVPFENYKFKPTRYYMDNFCFPKH
jgi:succinate dehydrogenase/fumarate reductase flavoprotein subunit